ncbi:hypothetical protein LCM28_09875 [Salipiger pacificus]|nr:hypothetical protein [Alloyangia pacifica]
MVSKSESYSIIIDVKGTEGTDAMLRNLTAMTNSMAALTKAAAANTNAMAREATELRKTADALGRTDAAAKRAAASSGLLGTNMKSWQIGGIAQQFSDMAVQLEMGAGAARVFGQQLPQIGTYFNGITGPALVFVGIATSLAPLLMSLTTGAKSFADATDTLRTVTDAAQSSLDVMKMTMDDLTAKYGDAADEVRRYAQIEATLRAADISQAMRQNVRSLQDFISSLGYATDDMGSSAIAIQKLQNQFELAGDEADAQAARIQGAFQRISDAGDMDQAIQRVEDLLALLDEMGIEATQLPDGFRKAAEEAIELHKQGAASEVVMEELNRLAGALPAQIGAAANEMARLDSNAQRALGALNALSGRTTDANTRLAGQRAYNQSLAEGNSIREAQIAQEYEIEKIRMRNALAGADGILNDEGQRRLDEYMDSYTQLGTAQAEGERLTKAWNDAQKETVTTAGAAAKAVADEKSEYEKYIDTLAKFRTVQEQADADKQAYILKSQEFRQQLANDPVGQELLNRAIEDANKRLKALSDAGQQVSDILEEAFRDFSTTIVTDFDDIGDAWSNLLDNMADQLLQMMMSSAFQQFFDALGQTNRGGGWLDTVGGWLTGGASRASQFSTVPANIPLAPSMPSRMVSVLPPRSIPSATRSAAAAPSVYIEQAPGTSVTPVPSRTGDAAGSLRLAVEREVQGLFNRGSMDRTMRFNYGLRRTT